MSLDLVEVALPVAAKAVFADTLGWGYSLDERASGTITLQTGGPVSRESLLRKFETALASRGLSLRRSGRSVQIVPAGGTPDIRPVQGAGAEADRISEDFRQQFRAMMPVRPVLPPPPLPAAHQGSQGILRRMLE